MVFVVVPEIVPLPKLGLATGGIGAVYAVSSILGPTLGGAIVSRTTWRWVFLLKFVQTDPIGITTTNNWTNSR
jgi:MFS family permease